jgi:hypothetical protein
MSIKPSELLPSVHAYLSTRYPKAAKALQKEALLAAPARDAVVPLEAAAAAWSRRQARRGLDGAADLPRAVHSFLADCKLERAAKALRKEGRLRGAASPAAPLLEMARLHARRAARGSAQIRLRATPRAVWAHPTHWLIRTQARRAARRGAAAAADGAAPAKEKKRRAAGGGGAAAPPKKKKRRGRSASEELRAAEARAAADAAERRAAADAVAAWVARQDAAPAPAAAPAKKKAPRAPGRQFERVDSARWLAAISDERLKDNSYEGTYGAGGWGARASAKLGKVRGKDFRHEKTKKKRGGYRGGAVDLGSNSIKFADSDDDD